MPLEFNSLVFQALKPPLASPARELSRPSNFMTSEFSKLLVEGVGSDEGFLRWRTGGLSEVL